MTGLLLFLLAVSVLHKTAAPAPKPIIQGIVRDSRGTAVPDALVAVFQDVRTPTQDPPLIARTDAQGRFSIDLKGLGTHTVRVEAEGLAGQTLKKVSPGASLSITLTKGLFIEGTAREAQGRAPVGGARVEAREEGARGHIAEPDLNRFETVTDDKGYYRISGLSAGLHSIAASARGLGSATKSGARPGGGPVNLFLFTGASIVGTVYGPDDRPLKGVDVETHTVDLSFAGVRVAGVVREKDSETPLAGARITALADTEDPAARSSAGATSANDGRFEMELDPGKYPFSMSASGAEGDMELTLPASTLELVVAKDKMEGRVTVRVQAEVATSAEVILTKVSPK